MLDLENLLKTKVLASRLGIRGSLVAWLSPNIRPTV